MERRSSSSLFWIQVYFLGEEVGWLELEWILEVVKGGVWNWGLEMRCRWNCKEGLSEDRSGEMCAILEAGIVAIVVVERGSREIVKLLSLPNDQRDISPGHGSKSKTTFSM
jgi:hypothetical protein